MCVHATLFVFAILRADVLFSRKSHEAFTIDVNSKRVIARYNDINPQIKLVTIQQERVVDVPGDDASFVPRNILEFIKNEDTFALGRAGGLHDPHVTFVDSLDVADGASLLSALILTVLVVVFEGLQLFGEHECFRDEVEVSF